VLLLFAGQRNPFQYVEAPKRPVAVKQQKTVPVPAAVTTPSIVVEAERKIPLMPVFPYRCIGRFGPDANPFAVFDGGGAIINVRAGEVIDGKFVVRAIGIESVTIVVDGFPEQRVSIGAER
jgi:hypothetical protein